MCSTPPSQCDNAERCKNGSGLPPPSQETINTAPSCFYRKAMGLFIGSGPLRGPRVWLITWCVCCAGCFCRQGLPYFFWLTGGADHYSRLLLHPYTPQARPALPSPPPLPPPSSPLAPLPLALQGSWERTGLETWASSAEATRCCADLADGPFGSLGAGSAPARQG